MEEKVHAHHAHLLLALEVAQVRLQRGFAAAGYHVVDGVVFEIAEGSREALAAAEEMLVDAEYARAYGVGALGHHTTQAVLKPTLHGRRTDPLPLADAAAANAVPVVEKDLPAQRLAGPRSR